jgi:FHS family L-fucose permease-like MFS transporter
LFYPAAQLRLYPLFLAAFFVLASGITLLQVAANPYVTLLGDPATASSRLTLTQAFNALGTTIAPYLGAVFILATAVKTSAELAQLDAGQLAAYQSAQASAVQQPYLLLAAALFVVAGVFAAIKLPTITDQTDPQPLLGASPPSQSSAWQYRHLVLGAVAIFVYVGGEVAIGSFLVSFLTDPNLAALTEQNAAKYVAFYWGGAMVGRFLGSVIMQAIPARKVLAFNALTAALLVLVTMLGRGDWVMWTILAVGLFNSIMFPTIFSLALTGLGQHTGQGSGILCAAIVGGAIIPLLQGLFADHIGLQQAFFIPILCYLYIAYYGWRGCAVRA